MTLWHSIERVSGVHDSDGHPFTFCFVIDKEPQFSKGLFGVSVLMYVSNCCPQANALEIFNRDRPKDAFDFRDNAFGNHKVRIPLEPPFSA